MRNSKKKLALRILTLEKAFDTQVSLQKITNMNCVNMRDKVDALHSSNLSTRIKRLEYLQKNPDGYGAILYDGGNLEIHQLYADDVVCDGMYLPDGDWEIIDISRRNTCKNVYVTLREIETGLTKNVVLENDTFKELPGY